MLIRRRRFRRPRDRQWVLVGITWIAATAICLFVATETKIGPILISVSFRHGIHAGDVIAFAVCYTVALLATYNIVRSRL